MILDSKRKALLDIDLSIWAHVKYFATIRNISVNEAVQLLLQEALNKYGNGSTQEVKPNHGVLSL
jgi:hypothetical protein